MPSFKHTKWEISINSSPIIDDSQLRKVIKEVLFPTKIEKAYLTFLEKINKGVLSTHKEDTQKVKIFESKRNGRWSVLSPPISELYESAFYEIRLRSFGKKLIMFVLQDRPSSWSHPILDLNYRICLEVARNVFALKPDKEDWCLLIELSDVREIAKKWIESSANNDEYYGSIKRQYKLKRTRELRVESSEIDQEGDTTVYIFKGYID